MSLSQRQYGRKNTYFQPAEHVACVWSNTWRSTIANLCSICLTNLAIACYTVKLGCVFQRYFYKLLRLDEITAIKWLPFILFYWTSIFFFIGSFLLLNPSSAQWISADRNGSSRRKQKDGWQWSVCDWRQLRPSPAILRRNHENEADF